MFDEIILCCQRLSLNWFLQKLTLESIASLCLFRYMTKIELVRYFTVNS